MIVGLFDLKKINKTVFVIVLLSVSFWVELHSQSSWRWQNVNIQGMGLVSGMVIHPDNPDLVYARTDVGGVFRFIRDQQRWINLTDHFNVEQNGVLMVESIALSKIAPSNIYIAANGNSFDGLAAGEVYISDDYGTSWNSTDFEDQNVYVGGNDAYRASTGERLAVDPFKPDRMFFGSRKDGLFLYNGTEWSKILIDGVPETLPDPGISFVVFDSTSYDPDISLTKLIYIGVFGYGVYKSIDAGYTWENIYSQQTNPVRAHINGHGTLLVSFGGHENSTSGSVRKFKNGTWEDITPLNPSARRYHAYTGLSSDPSNPDVIMVNKNNSSIYRSLDEGASWQEVQYVENNPAYYPPNANEWGRSSLIIDPKDPLSVWIGTGFGIMKTDDITESTSQWYMEMNGLEELMVQDIKTPYRFGSFDLITGVGDVVGFIHTSKDTVPTHKHTNNYNYVAMATSIGITKSDPGTIVWVGFDEINSDSNIINGYSTDNGQTWRKLSNQYIAGTIVVSSSDNENLVWVPSDTRNNPPVFTRNGGVTWQTCNNITQPYIQDPFFQKWNKWWNGKVLAADQVNGEKFYFFNNGHFFYSNDGGENWNTGANNLPRYYIQTNISVNPAREGDVWITFKPNDNMLIPNDCKKIYRSVDGGEHFEPLNSVDYAYYAAFGKGNTPDNPFVYMHGRANGDNFDGVYKSEDMGLTWQLISDPAMNRFPAIWSMEADMRIRDLVYLGTNGRGIFYGIKGNPATGISIYPYSGESIISPGESVQMIAEVVPRDADEQQIGWQVENITGEAIIDQNGFFTAIAEGRVKIIATIEDDWGKFVEYEMNISDQTNTSQLQVWKDGAFPNPVSKGNTFSVLTPNIQQGKITITDSSGKLIYKRTFEGTDKIENLSVYQSGIYYIQVEDATRKMVYTIVVQ